MSLQIPPLARLRPRRRGIASLHAEARDGIVPAATSVALTDDHAGGEPASSNYRTLALIIATSLFMEFLDATVLATALPTMARDFGVAATEMSVALTFYLIALAIFIPASGPLADRFGSKAVFRTAIALFVAGSISCALTPTLGGLIVARFLQGFGGAMMLPVGRLVLLRSVAKRDMVSAMTWLITPALIGPILGPPLGGFIVTYLDWRWIFWINAPLGLLGIVLTTLYVPDLRENAPYPFDWKGFALAGVSLGSLLGGFEFGSRSGYGMFAAALLGVGGASGLFYVRHARTRARPILDIALMRVPTFRLSVLAGSLTRITQGAQPFLLPLLLQLGFGLDPAHSGMVAFAPALGSLGMKGAAPRILRRFGFRTSLIAMGLLSSVGYATCALFRPGWPLPVIFGILLVSGFFMSFQFTAYNTIAYDEIDKQGMSAATSFYATFQQLMLSIGICVAAVSLHVVTAVRHHPVPAFADYGSAYLVVTAISFSALLFNRRFAHDAGDELAGRARA